MKRRLLSIPIVPVLGLALLIGCARPKPFEYHPATEIPKGPGLFSKDAGEFSLYDSNKNSTAAKQSPDKTTGPPEAASSIQESEYREFQQWHDEREEFKAFQQWKQSRQGTAEYEEFREWQRWQAFKKWQESQSKDR